MQKAERNGEKVKWETNTINPEYLECPNCRHQLDNHSYKGCSVERCHCKLVPSAIVIARMGQKLDKSIVSESELLGEKR